MKRILTLITAAMLVFGVAGNAMAAFDTGTFVASANDGTNEAIINLGTLSDLGSTVLDTGLDLTYFTEADSWADVNLGGFAGLLSSTTSFFNQYEVMVAVDDYSLVTGVGGNYTTILGMIDNVYYNSDGSGDVQDLTDATYGYKYQLDSLGMARFVDGTAQYLLSGIEENTITMDIAYFVSEDWGSTWTYMDTGYDLLFYLDDDGSLIAEVSVVPVPGALVLFGSALLGVVGIRRKKA